MNLTKIDTIAGIPIYAVKGHPPSFLYLAGMTIDADGSPRCYGPNNSGIDHTANGGEPGDNWWGGPTDAGGYPLIQKIYDPHPGMYVSATAHFDPVYPESSPYRYLDSERIPFIVLPGGHSNGAKLGDVCLCLNTKTGDNCYGIYGDVGPGNKLGEASMRMAHALKIDNNPKTGGTESKHVAYLVFPGSIGEWVAPSIWFHMAHELFQAWGNLDKLRMLLEEM